MRNNLSLYRILFVFALIVLFSACAPRLSVEVDNIANINAYKKPGIAYYLPQTSLIVNFRITKVEEKKGPFADYASEFLGNVDVIRQNKTYWEISGVNIDTRAVRDTQNLWLITGNMPWIFAVNLTPEGFLASINANDDTVYKQDYGFEQFVNQEKLQSIGQNIVTVDRGYKEVYDTVFKVETFDTIRRVVPIIKKRLIQKTVREQAREIADEIFSLRDDRNALLVGEGDSDYLPDGLALKEMLAGIDKLERQYLSLFIGRVDKTNYHYRYQWTPKIKNHITERIIYRFSPHYGLLPPTDMRGDPVYLIIKTMGTTEGLRNFYQTQDLLRRVEGVKANYNGLAYRIPELVSVQIKVGERLVAQKHLFLPQAGVVARLPLSLLSNPDVEIYFNPWTGSLQKINYRK